MSDMKSWEKRVLAVPGAAGRVAEIEEELRLAAGLTALREQAGLSQRELARKMGISNVTIDVLEQYVGALGGRLELTVVKGRQKIPLTSSGARQPGATKRPARRPAKSG